LIAAVPFLALWSYVVDVSPGAKDLAIEAIFPQGTDLSSLAVSPSARRFVRDLKVTDRVRYRFALEEAARTLGSELAAKQGSAIHGAFAAWLLRPSGAPPGTRFRVTLRTPPGLRFATGTHRAPDGALEANAEDLADAPGILFNPSEVEKRTVRGGTLEIAFVPAKRRLSSSEIVSYIETSADTVGAFYGRFPVKQVTVFVLPQDERAPHGRSMGEGGATVLLWLGADTAPADLASDWVLVHELTHLGFPSVPRPEAAWLDEGMATYIEPIARARMGRLPVEKVWADMVSGMPKGLPERGDRGLDRTFTWGRTYWGGAIFCLLADIRIRERTQGKRTLADAFRGVLEAGGDIEAHWPLERVIAEADRATGVPVFKELHDEHGERPGSVDLDALWRKLGVRAKGFDDKAPLAEIRRAITR
jgi:predicted metalloprotease with PDZ domain